MNVGEHGTIEHARIGVDHGKSRLFAERFQFDCRIEPVIFDENFT